MRLGIPTWLRYASGFWASSLARGDGALGRTLGCRTLDQRQPALLLLQHALEELVRLNLSRRADDLELPARGELLRRVAVVSSSSRSRCLRAAAAAALLLRRSSRWPEIEAREHLLRRGAAHERGELGSRAGPRTIVRGDRDRVDHLVLLAVREENQHGRGSLSNTAVPLPYDSRQEPGFRRAQAARR
jgi:hypothetical protein